MKTSSFSNFLNISDWKLTPYQILSLGFFSLISVGTLLLMLPVSTASGASMRFVDALFTATSAVCVTGLVVVDTGSYFSLFGQTVIILLIQAGALGVMTMATLMAVLMRKRIQLRDRLVMQEALNQLTFSGIVRLSVYICKITFFIEFIGGTLLALRFFPDFGMDAFYLGYWHSISAFCNAGFDVFGATSRPITYYVDDYWVCGVLAALIILGGIGFAVLGDVWRSRKFKLCSLQSKIVLSTTAIILLAGTSGIFLLEYDNAKTIGALSVPAQFLASFFQTATARTAGYSMLNPGALTDASLFFIICIMFIGASPGSTGSGIKTTTIAVIFASIWNLMRGRNEAVLFYRRISPAIVYKAFAIFFIAAAFVSTITMMLSISENFTFIQILFEVVSAFSTTGLSTGITGGLSDYAKICLAVTMFVGRIGPVTFALALAMKSKKRMIQYPEGKITIG